jgi:Putative zinc finger in N-recognin (UBR box)
LANLQTNLSREKNDNAMSTNTFSLNNEVAVAETITFTPDQQTVYQAAARVLSEPPAEFLAPIPKIVSVELLDLGDSSSTVATGTTGTTGAATGTGTATATGTSNSDHDLETLLTPTRGHHELYRALEGLEGLEKDEASLASRAPLVRELTQLVTGIVYRDAAHALTSLEQLGQAVPRRVCQHPFKKNDIVWVCRTCQADETCVLCHACYSQSDHVGHDVAFYHAQAGGCCDCGDPDGTCFCDCNQAVAQKTTCTHGRARL